MTIKFSNMGQMKKFVERCLVEGSTKDTYHSKFMDVKLDFFFMHVTVEHCFDDDVLKLEDFLKEKGVTFSWVSQY